MKFQFILPGTGVHGGIKSVIEIGKELIRLGHGCEVLFPRPSLLARYGAYRKTTGISRSLLATLLDLRRERSADFLFGCPRSMARPIADLDVQHLSPSDAIVATAWQTASLVHAAPSSCGTKAYFLQHYETWSATKEIVDATWRLPMKRVVVSSWLEGIARDLEVDVAGRIVYGIDHDRFSREPPIRSDDLTIGMMYHVYDWKGIPDGLSALKRVHRKHPHVRALLFGAYHPTEPLPEWVEFHFEPPQELIPSLFRRCQIWLCPSWSEGAGMPNMEAMACGCAVVSTDVGSTRDFATPGETILLSPPKDVEALTENLLKVVENESLRESMARSGSDHVRRFTWRKAAEDFVRAIFPS